jgi:hypothetical protein
MQPPFFAPRHIRAVEITVDSGVPLWGISLWSQLAQVNQILCCLG